MLKNNIRIEAYGTVDELNSVLGWVSAKMKDEELINFLQQIQSLLFNIGATLAANPEKELHPPDVMESDIELLENAIDEITREVPELRHFILPGGNEVIAATHMARTVCRRAERRCVELAQETEVPTIILRYLNRLSDYLFILGRSIAYKDGVEEVKWMPRKT